MRQAAQTGLEKASCHVQKEGTTRQGPQSSLQSGEWSWPRAAKETKVLVIQLQGSELCQQPVSWEKDPEPQTRLQPWLTPWLQPTAYRLLAEDS